MLEEKNGRDEAAISFTDERNRFFKEEKHMIYFFKS